MDESNYAVGPIKARAAVTVDFGLPAELPLNELAPVIERDRQHMAKRPGMRSKHLPFRIDSTSGNYLSGGRYLFDSLENAERYKSWAGNEFVLDGFKFFERPFFLDAVCHVWSVIGAHDFADIHSAHTVIRSERWQLRSGRKHDFVQCWSEIYREAEKRNLASVWLLENGPEELAGIVSITGGVAPAAASQSINAGLEAVESAAPLGTMFERLGWTKVFDRTSWVLTIWFPITEGQADVAPLWPNSPPLPGPRYALSTRSPGLA